MLRIRLVHTTQYAFEAPVSGGSLEVRLRPRELQHQKVLFHQLVIRPAVRRSPVQGRFGEQVQRLELVNELQSLEIHATTELQIRERPPPPDTGHPWAEVAEELAGQAQPELRELTAATGELARARVQELARAYAAPSFAEPNRSLIEAAHDLEERFRADFSYDSGATTAQPPLRQIFETRRGVCQDLARALIGALRSQGLAARYVGGYLFPTPGTGSIGRAENHAWVSVWLPGNSWLDLDPGVGPQPGYQRVTVGWGADSADVTPIRGCFNGGGRQRLVVKVYVEQRAG